jgi:hypothetical protein
MTEPRIGLPRKSDADWTSDLRKRLVTSDTVNILVAGIGSDRGVGASEAAGVYAGVCVVVDARGVGAG